MPGLGQLPALVDQMDMAGLAVSLTLEGPSRPLATSIDLSLYRVVQESLTNALKHARAGSAAVMVRYGEHDIEVKVTDDGRGMAPSINRSEGAGTIGMRERVALFGGTLQVGPRPQGGYVVRVCLPIEEPMTIRVVLSDDQELVRAGFRMILGTQEDIEVVAEAGDGTEAVEAARKHRPDVVLMDIRMPNLDGLEATKRIVGGEAASRAS